MDKSKIYWLCQIFGWAIYGILQISLLSVVSGVNTKFVVGEIFQVVFYIILTHFFRWFIIKVGWLKYKWYGILPRFLGANFILSIIHYFFLILISSFTGELNPSLDFQPFSIIASLLISTMLFFFWSMLYISFHYFDRYSKSLQYEAAIKDIELTNLKSQLNPHFIFNSLNSIRALVDENPNKSKVAITQLSNILRNSMKTDLKKLIPFNEEFSTVRDYLALETIRYEERLRTKFQIDPSSNNFDIPPLMLQTLVENGIKHGISNLKDGGIIHIKTKKTIEGLTIQIRNSGRFADGALSDVGYGILNTRKRLELIYGQEAKFEIGNEGADIVLTQITIPNNL